MKLESQMNSFRIKGLHCRARFELQASLPVVDNNRKVVGALSVVGEKFSKILAKNCKIFRDFLTKKMSFAKMLHFGENPENFWSKFCKIENSAQ